MSVIGSITREFDMKHIVRIDQSDRKLLYMQVIEGIRNGIQKGHLQPGDKLPNERELARQLGVSTSIVSIALSALADEGLIRRRRQQGTFVADVELGEIARPQSSNIGMIFTNVLGVLMEDIVKGVQDVLSEMDYHTFLCDCSDEIDREINHVNALIDKGVDGLIIFPINQKKGTRTQLSHYRRLLQARIPCVLIDRYIKNINMHAVLFDNYGWAYRSVSNLLELGHERIAYFTPPEEATSLADRLQGYKDALKESGIKLDPNLVKHCVRDDSNLSEIAEKVVNMGATAIVCAKSNLSMELQRILEGMNGGRSGEICIVGVDLPLVAISSETGASDLPYRMGRRAAEVLFGTIKGGSTEVVRIVLGTDVTPDISRAALGSNIRQAGN